MPDYDEVKQVKDQYQDALLARPNVIGVGAGLKNANGHATGEVSIIALVKEKKPLGELKDGSVIPKEIEGVPTDVIEVGEVKTQTDRTRRWRPAPGGVSVGHPSVPSGTFGCVVRDRQSGARLLLSNNHVLANCNSAMVGDPILQPGASSNAEVGQDTLAYLSRFCPIRFEDEFHGSPHMSAWLRIRFFLARKLGLSGWLKRLQEEIPPTTAPINIVDAAVARPVSDVDILDEILEIGRLDGSILPGLGMEVRKSGRSTGLTTGRITVLDTTVSVSYEPGRNARFEHQILTTPMSNHGDSGAMLVKRDEPLAVGLLFAGSKYVTIFNPIQTVLDCLEVSI